jgi:hypothetical protein
MPPKHATFIRRLLAGEIKACRYRDDTDEWEDLDVIAVGGIYETTSAVNPGLAQLAGGLGYGAWERFGNGRVLVGVDEGDADFAPGNTVGAKSVTPAGSCSAPTFTGSSVASQAVSAGTPSGTVGAHTTAADSNTTGGTNKVTGSTHTFTGSALPTHAHNVTAAGTVSAPAFTGVSHTNVQPSIAVYRWRRVS